MSSSHPESSSAQAGTRAAVMAAAAGLTGHPAVVQFALEVVVGTERLQRQPELLAVERLPHAQLLRGRSFSRAGRRRPAGRPSHLLQVVLRGLQERLSGAEPAAGLGRVRAQTLLLEPGAHLRSAPARERDVHGAAGGDGRSLTGSDGRDR